MTMALSVAGVGAAVLAAAGAALYLVAFSKREKKKTLQLGESSSRRLCRDVEAMVMPAPPQVSLLRPARPLGCEEFTLRELSRLIGGFAEEAKIGSGNFTPHDALHDHLHGGAGAAGGASPLFASWEARLRVALDTARGMQNLYCYAVPPIIHRDVKFLFSDLLK